MFISAFTHDIWYDLRHSRHEQTWTVNTDSAQLEKYTVYGPGQQNQGQLFQNLDFYIIWELELINKLHC